MLRHFYIISIYFSLLTLIQVFLLLINSSKQCELTLDTLIKDRINVVKKVAAEMEELFKNKCEILKNYNKEDCSYNACSETLPPFYCDKRQTLLECQDCYDKGVMASNQSSIFKVQMGTISDPEVMEMIVASSKLDEIFKKYFNEDETMIYIYFGSTNGIIRLFPGIIWCQPEYDPRIRPWYVAASSGIKNIILVIDISNSMTTNIGKEKTRFDVIKEAVISVINTLTNFDFMGLITFSSDANSYQPTLVKANDANKEKLINYIQNLTTNINTNYEAAFRQTFELIKTTQEAEIATSSQTIVQFITDGETTQGKQSDELLEYLEEEKNNLKNNITVFTYAIGVFKDEQKDLLNNIACKFKGMFLSLNDNDDIKTAMTNYYRFIAATLTFETAAWAGPYIDAIGSGKLISASYPVYLRTQEPPLFIGVISIDMLMTKFNELEGNENIILASLQKNQMQYVKNNLTDCQLQNIRGENTCPDINMSECINLQTNQEVCSTELGSETVYCGKGSITKESVDFNSCCGDSNCHDNLALIIGLSAGGSAVALVILGILVYIYQQKLKQKNQKKKDEQKNKNVESIFNHEMVLNSKQAEQGQGDQVDLEKIRLSLQNAQNQQDNLLGQQQIN